MNKNIITCTVQNEEEMYVNKKQTNDKIKLKNVNSYTRRYCQKNMPRIWKIISQYLKFKKNPYRSHEEEFFLFTCSLLICHATS